MSEWSNLASDLENLMSGVFADDIEEAVYRIRQAIYAIADALRSLPDLPEKES